MSREGQPVPAPVVEPPPHLDEDEAEAFVDGFRAAMFLVGDGCMAVGRAASASGGGGGDGGPDGCPECGGALVEALGGAVCPDCDLD